MYYLFTIYFSKVINLLLPVLTSHNLTVPSSEEVTTNLVLNCKHVTAELCLFEPFNKKLNVKHTKCIVCIIMIN